MNFTISDCMSRINQALNYPSISYEDVSHFFDQAISELNTILHTAIPTVTEMRIEHTFKVNESPNAVAMSSVPDRVQTAYVYDGSNMYSSVDKANVIDPTEHPIVYLIQGFGFEHSLYIYKNGSWTKTDKAYLIVAGNAYEAIAIANISASYVPTPINTVTEFSLTEYLPVDWIILFLIPYVCFKFSVRNGDNGALFSDEFTQGLQQLQTSYSVPSSVQLKDVAHLTTYKSEVFANLNDLFKKVPTKAITTDMRIPSGVHPVYGNIYDHGGWGI